MHEGILSLNFMIEDSSLPDIFESLSDFHEFAGEELSCAAVSTENGCVAFSSLLDQGDGSEAACIWDTELNLCYNPLIDNEHFIEDTSRSEYFEIDKLIDEYRRKARDIESETKN